MGAVIEYCPVLTKTDFVRRYSLGEFGNRSPTWDSWEGWAKHFQINADRDAGLYHLRNRQTGGSTFYNLSIHTVNTNWMRQEYKDQWYVSEMCPTYLTQIQGEVMRTARGLYLYYSHVKKPMRDSLSEGGVDVTGLGARMMLEHFMDTNSWEWLNHLLDSYPDHVIEFTTLSKRWGTNQGFNSLFWEVRSY